MAILKRIISIGLVMSFALIFLVPITGIAIHKISSAIFLLLSIIHTLIYIKGMNIKKLLLLIIVLIAFISGIMAMLGEFWLVVHRTIGIISIIAIAIHLFVYHKRIVKNK